jgi:transposase
MLHHDNAPHHAPLLIRSYLAKHQTSIVPHPPYSPDLISSDFFLIPKLKTTFKGRRFQTTEEIQENAIIARHQRKCVPGSIPTMKETLGTVYRQ